MSQARRDRRAAGKTKESQFYLQQSEYNGPVPLPDDLAKYENIQPGFADRLISMAEKEQEWRQSLLNQQQESNGKWNKTQQSIQKTGQWMGIISVGLVIALCGYCAYLGFGREAMYIAIGVIVSLAAVFVINRKKSES